MKKIGCFIVLIVALQTVSAQNIETEIFRSYFKMEKRSVIADFMQLEEEMEISFWTIYDEYESKRSRLAIDRIALLREVNQKVNSINDEMAQNWMDQVMERLDAEEKLRKKYVLLLSKETNPIIALKFAQFDQYFNAVINYQFFQQMQQINSSN